MTKLSKTLIKASFVGTFAEQMLLPIWSKLVDRVGGNILDAGIGFAIFSIITGFTVIVLGRTKWYEKNVNWMVFWGFAVAGIAEVSYIFVGNRWELYLVQSIVGVSVGLLNPAWDALYSEDEETSHSKKWSFWSGGVSFVIGVASIVGAFIVKRFGWTTLFVSMGISDVLATYYAWRVAVIADQEQ